MKLFSTRFAAFMTIPLTFTMLGAALLWYFEFSSFEKRNTDTLSGNADVKPKSSYESVDKNFTEAQKHYKLAIEQLNQVMLMQNGKISPEIEREFENNMDIINQSINDWEKVLIENPDNQEAKQSLLKLYETKMKLVNKKTSFFSNVKNWGEFFYWLWRL